MLIKLFLFITLTLSAHSAIPDEEIIKNLEFFQSIDMLKEETVLAASPKTNAPEESKSEEHQKSNAEKKQ